MVSIQQTNLEVFGPKFPIALKKEKSKLSEAEIYMWNHFTRVWDGQRIFDFPGVEAKANIVFCSLDEEEIISDEALLQCLTAS